MHDLAVVCLLTLVPTIAMMVGSLVVVWFPPGPKLTAALLQLASGVVTCAIATEFTPVLMAPLTPELDGAAPTARDEAVAYAFKLLGFVLGVVVMFAVEIVSNHISNAREKDFDCTGSWRHIPILVEQPPDAGCNPDPPPTSTGHYTEHLDIESRLIVRKKGWKNLPWGVVASIAVNAALDGFLISISYTAEADISTGIIVSAALALEMCFVGISLGTSLAGYSRGIVFVICSSVSLLLMIAGIPGAVLIPLMGDEVTLLLYSFGIANLLFLVVDELLLDAHKIAGGDKCWICMWFFVGFFGILTVDLALDLVTEFPSLSSSSSLYSG